MGLVVVEIKRKKPDWMPSRLFEELVGIQNYMISKSQEIFELGYGCD